VPGAENRKNTYVTLEGLIFRLANIAQYIPGVSFGFSTAGFNPKLNCGDESSLTFSGQYAPGAIEKRKTITAKFTTVTF